MFNHITSFCMILLVNLSDTLCMHTSVTMDYKSLKLAPQFPSIYSVCMQQTLNFNMSFLPIAARLYLTREYYFAMEASGRASVCVALDGVIKREVVANIFTIDGSAEGEYRSF